MVKVGKSNGEGSKFDQERGNDPPTISKGQTWETWKPDIVIKKTFITIKGKSKVEGANKKFKGTNQKFKGGKLKV